MAIVSSCYPRAKNFPEDESSQQTVNIRSTNEIHAKKGYIPIVYAPQESTSVQNVLVIILHVPKTIFQHRAEFSCSKPKKIGMPMTINSSRFSVTTLGSFGSSASTL